MFGVTSRREEHEAKGWFPVAMLKTASPMAKAVRPALDHTVSGTRWSLVPLRKEAGPSEFDSFCCVFDEEQASLVSGPLCGLQCVSQDLWCQPDAFISL